MSESDIQTLPAIQTTGIAARSAVTWFLCDMAEVSGFAITKSDRAGLPSLYPQYRPVLTKADPWYYAGSVAIEAAKICDLFPSEECDALLRDVLDRIDTVIKRKNTEVSTLAFLLLGRLGLGAVLMRRRVPDDMLGKIMMVLIGSEANAAELMPSPDAHRQLRKALKFGVPVWWSVFKRYYHIELDERPLRRAEIAVHAASDII